MLCLDLAGSAAPPAAILRCIARGSRVGRGWIGCACYSCFSWSDVASVSSVTIARSSFPSLNIPTALTLSKRLALTTKRPNVRRRFFALAIIVKISPSGSSEFPR
jgi:hypothetical protein